MSEREIMAVANACSQDLADTYETFRTKLSFKTDVAFLDVVKSFQPLALEFVRLNYPSVYSLGHTGTFFRVMMSGIDIADIDPKADVERVARQLGVDDRG